MGERTSLALRYLFALMLAAWLHPAHARAISSCEILSITSVSFGGYRAGDGRPLDSTGNIVYTCHGVHGNDMLTIEISRSRSGHFEPRAMSGQGYELEYNVYLNAGRTRIWGDGTEGTNVYRRRPQDGREMSVPIYGRIPPRQSVPSGPYADTLIITMQF